MFRAVWLALGRTCGYKRIHDSVFIGSLRGKRRRAIRGNIPRPAEEMRRAYPVSRPLNRNHMNLSKLSQIIFVGVCAGSFFCSDANGQITGTGTTGSTAGSGRGEGSAGVMTGTGPDPSKISTPYEQTITERMIVMPGTQRKKGARVRKRSKKTGNKTSTTQNAPAPAASASPSPR